MWSRRVGSFLVWVVGAGKSSCSGYRDMQARLQALACHATALSRFWVPNKRVCLPCSLVGLALTHLPHPSSAPSSATTADEAEV